MPDTLPDLLLAAHRASLDAKSCLTPPCPWAPLTDAEWEHIAPFLAALGCGLSFTPRPGRPPEDTRGRLDAIFRAVTLKRPEGAKGSGGGRSPWRQLPAAHGKPDTVSRSYRRWARAGLWRRLLTEVGCPTCPPVLRTLTHWICCAYRRAIRIMGLDSLLLARRLRLFSALPAPATCLPDPDLSERLRAAAHVLLRQAFEQRRFRAFQARLRALRALHGLCGGRARLTWRMEPA